MPAPKVFSGTSGWAYPAWKPGFYPKEVSAKKFLNHYATKLNSVEVNYTFRTFLSPATAASWLAATPADFLFTFKANQSITHFRRLKQVDELVAAFFNSIVEFERAGKLGAVLFQLPHNMKCDLPLFSDFLAGLPRKCGIAIEFRHESWLNDGVYSAMREHQIALCVTEGQHELSTPDIELANFAYYRLRRRKYPTKRIRQLAAQFAKSETNPIFVYFKHEETPQGALNAQKLLKVVKAQASQVA